MMDNGKRLELLQKAFPMTDLTIPVRGADPLIDGVIQKSDGPTFLAGSPGSGKTTLCAQLAVELAKGSEWTILGRNALERQARVLVIPKDGGTQPFRRLLQKVGIDKSCNDYLLVWDDLSGAPVPTLKLGQNIIPLRIKLNIVEFPIHKILFLSPRLPLLTAAYGLHHLSHTSLSAACRCVFRQTSAHILP